MVGGLCLLPSGLAQLALSPVSALISRRFGPKITLCSGSLVVATGFAIRIVATAHLWEIMAGTTIAGAGIGIAYAAMPALIALGAPHSELAAANGLNSLCRASGGSLASAVGGTILASSVVVVGGVALPSLTAYRLLFVLCAVAAVLGAGIALLVPYPPDYSPSEDRPGRGAGMALRPAAGERARRHHGPFCWRPRRRRCITCDPCPARRLTSTSPALLVRP